MSGLLRNTHSEYVPLAQDSDYKDRDALASPPPTSKEDTYPGPTEGPQRRADRMGYVLGVLVLMAVFVLFCVGDVLLLRKLYQRTNDLMDTTDTRALPRPEPYFR